MDNNYYVNLNLTSEEMKGHLIYLKPYLDTILRRVPNLNATLLEVGIGTGACLSYFETGGYVNTFGIDNNEALVHRFRNELSRKFKTNAQVKFGDAFYLSEITKELHPITCIFHQGLLEHFSDDQVSELLRHHTEVVSHYVIFAVPIEGYSDDGEYDPDEVRHTLEWWLEKLSPFVLYEYGVFGVDVEKNQAYFVISKHHK